MVKQVQLNAALVSTDSDKKKQYSVLVPSSWISSESLKGHDVIDLPIDSLGLKRIVAFWRQSKGTKEPYQPFEIPLRSMVLGELLSPWYAQFIESIAPDELVPLLFAARLLSIKPLEELIALRMAIMAHGK
jgi:hypothetical protein